MERIHLIISGKVQGVGFRYHTRQTAEELGLVGWVKNLTDGTVETLAEGDPSSVEQFGTWCRKGPVGARVDRVDIVSRGPVHTLEFTNFRVTK